MLRHSRRTHGAANSTRLLRAGDWAKLRRTAAARCTDEAVLQPSLIPTRHFQRSLPRLPVPQLGGSLFKYAAAVKPLVPPAQYAKTVKLLKDFELKEGGKLQDELVSVDHANQHTSFIASDWFDKVLKEREPIPFRHSRTLLVRSPVSSPAMDMLSRATLWVRSSVLFYKAYLDNTLYPDVRYVPDDTRAYYQQDWFERTVALCPEYFSSGLMSMSSAGHAVPLDMSQFDNLFNSTRAPGVLQDEVRAVGYMPHIVVQYRGRQFAVTVADADSNPLPEDQIYARLRAVVTSSAASSRPAVDVSAFTTLPRTEWNGARTTLLRTARNQKSLETLDSSMFILNLDDELTGDFLSTPAECVRQSAAKAGNRWWDKSLTVNVASSGAVSVSYEESWGDGTAVSRYVEDVYQHSMLRMVGGSGVVQSSTASESVRELTWSLTPDLQHLAVKVLRTCQQETGRLDVGLAVVELPVPAAAAQGDGAPAAQGTVDTNALVQVAIQVAWWRLNTSTVSTVVPVAMNSFRRGRMDCVYAASTESQELGLALTQGKAGPDARGLCLRALARYGSSAKEVEAGAGVYAHLMALRSVSQRMYGRTPALFQDQSYQMLTAPQLISSCDTAPSLLATSANPAQGGYGVACTAVSGAASSGQSLVVNVSSFQGADGPRHSSSEFATAILEAMGEITRLVAP